MKSLQGIDKAKQVEMPSLFLMLGLSLLVASFSNYLGELIASLGFLNPMIWVIIVSSALGMVGASTTFGNLGGSEEVSTIMLYVIVALIGAEVSLGAILGGSHVYPFWLYYPQYSWRFITDCSPIFANESIVNRHRIDR
ncbi:MAG: hypothetical protein CM1200mP40_28350 [Gammaproteobacteria bacterium]|nr:MAG: hypothetical protein CM1200mP40_28350 [Gammaproteobacteria bacterium]